MAYHGSRDLPDSQNRPCMSISSSSVQFSGLPGINDYMNYAETPNGGGLQWCVDGYIPCLKLICSRLWQLDDMVKQYLANLHLTLFSNCYI